MKHAVSDALWLMQLARRVHRTAMDKQEWGTLSQQQTPTAMEEHRGYFFVASHALRTLRESFLV